MKRLYFLTAPLVVCGRHHSPFTMRRFKITKGKDKYEIMLDDFITDCEGSMEILANVDILPEKTCSLKIFFKLYLTQANGHLKNASKVSNNLKIP